MPSPDMLHWLQTWWQQQCNGDREHQHGIKIGTLDNPGWSIHIDLRLSRFESMPERNIEIDNTEDNWMTCRIRDKQFEGYGDPAKLEAILQTFRNWIEAA